MSSHLGILLCVAGGVAGAVFTLPFRGVRNWRYESYWLVYALTGLVAVPLLLARLTCPSLLDILSSVPHRILWCCFGFGALWEL